MCRILLSYSFLETEHSVRKLFINLILSIRIVRIRMMAVVKLNYMKAATVLL